MAEAEQGFAFSCDYCRVEFGRDAYIQCAECRDIRLCITCFVEGMELPPHRKQHAYYVMEYVSDPIYDDDEWSGHSDILLLDGMEKYGVGNWQKMTMHIGNNKTAKETEAHYLRTYCSPNPTSQRADDQNTSSLDTTTHGVNAQNQQNGSLSVMESDQKQQEMKESGNDTERLIKSKDTKIGNDSNGTMSVFGGHQSHHKQRRHLQPIKGSVDLNAYRSSASYIAGTKSVHRSVNYYSNRHEFADGSEHWDDGELLVADLTATDLNEDESTCLRLLAQYQTLLRMRDFVKDFVLDRKLLLFFDKNRNRGSRNQRDIDRIRKVMLEKMKPFNKYFDGTAEYLRFVETNVMVKAARMPIERYIEYRKSGCRTTEDIRRREQEESRNSLRARHSKKRARCSWQIEDSDSPNDYPFGSVQDQESDLNANLSWNSTQRNSDNERISKKRKFEDALFTAKMVNDNELDLVTGSSASCSAGSTLPGALLLSRTERSFVEHCKILPAQYFQYKHIILMLNRKNGKVEKEVIQRMLPHFTSSRVDDICDFFQRLKWISVVK